MLTLGPHACRPITDPHHPTVLQLCKECFYYVFEEEVHECITRLQLFKRGERVALAASGGKDSTVLAHVVTTLNKRYE